MTHLRTNLKTISVNLALDFNLINKWHCEVKAVPESVLAARAEVCWFGGRGSPSTQLRIDCHGPITPSRPAIIQVCSRYTWVERNDLELMLVWRR